MIKRQFYIFKCRTHILLRNLAERFFKLLAEYGLVIEHKKNYTNVVDLTQPKPGPDACSPRFVFEVSYVLRMIESVSEYWFTNKKGKKLFVVWDNFHREGRISYRLVLKSFYAHFSPKQRMWVYRNAPVVYLSPDTIKCHSFSDGPVEPVEVKTHRCDFSPCTYAFEFSYVYEQGPTPEVFSESHKAISNGLYSKVTEINKILTGVDHDGEMLSPKKMPLADNLLCKKCGLPVFASAEDKYKFECLYCGEVTYIDVKRVDPVVYEDVLDNTFEILEDLIARKSCPQDSNL